MDDKSLIADPQTQIDELVLCQAVMRWLTFASLQHFFVIFKKYALAPTLFGSIPLMFLASPWAISFHVFFNKVGFDLRTALLCSFCAPFFFLLIVYLFYREMVSSSVKKSIRRFFFSRMVNFTFPNNYYVPASAKQLDFAAPLVVFHAVKSEEPIVRLFGLKQLQIICTGTPLQRKPLFALSQPGGHPRNWFALRDLAINLMREMSCQLRRETRKYCLGGVGGGHRGSSTSILDISLTATNDDGFCASSPVTLVNASPTIVLNELYEGKSAFFVPPSMKPRSADQFKAELHAAKQLRLPYFVELLLEKMSRLFLFRSSLMNTFETLSVLLAIKALTLTIVHSLEEDRFGVVQKDLKLCLSTLTRLLIDIDAYARAKSRSAPAKTTTNSGSDFNQHILDSELAEALKDLRVKFDPYISDLNLHPTELEVLRILG